VGKILWWERTEPSVRGRQKGKSRPGRTRPRRKRVGEGGKIEAKKQFKKRGRKKGKKVGGPRNPGRKTLLENRQAPSDNQARGERGRVERQGGGGSKMGERAFSGARERGCKGASMATDLDPQEQRGRKMGGGLKKRAAGKHFKKKKAGHQEDQTKEKGDGPPGAR